jgi:glycosyltransferase involved in cell wall biosynthesis
MSASSKGGLRVGIVTDGAEERTVDGETRIANGGVGVYIYQLVHHLLEAGSNDQFFLIRFGRGQLDIYRHPGANPVFLSAVPPKTLRMAGFAYARLVRHLRLDLLHFPNQFGGPLLPRYVRRVATLHDLTPLLFPAMHPRTRVWGYKLMARICLRRSDRVIVVSDATRRDLISSGLVDARAVITVPNGVAAGFSPGTSDPSFLAQQNLSRPYVLTVGVLEPRKNHVLLLKALQTLIRQGHDLDLIIIGRRGWRWSNPLELAEFESLRSRVRILTDVSEDAIRVYYRHAAIFAYPSLYEGFGLPILEAMACGTPVVCSATSSLPEVGGDAALYADPHNATEFAQQLERLLCDSALKRTMIARGVERAAQFSWRRTALRTLEVYRSVQAANQSTFGE